MSENISEAILYEFHIINLRAYEKSRSQYYRELLSNNVTVSAIFKRQLEIKS
jgi:hypothetical protein